MLLHDDVKLDNSQFVAEGQEERAMVVDLEQGDLDLSEEDVAWVVRENVETLVSRWREHLECLREMGYCRGKRTRSAHQDSVITP
jgi:hypothetical protein